MSLVVTILESTNDYADSSGKFELRITQIIGHCMPDLASVFIEPADLVNLLKAVEQANIDWKSQDEVVHISGEKKLTFTFKNENTVIDLNEQESDELRNEVRQSVKEFNLAITP